MVPALVKSFFGSYPESRRFFIYISWFLLLTPAGGVPIAAYAFVARAFGVLTAAYAFVARAFGVITAADAFGLVARLCCR
jgi:hypothetical protein